MLRKKIILKVAFIVGILELILSIMIIVGIFFGFPDIIRYYSGLLSTNSTDGLYLFRQFLGHVLTLVIGMEFVLMMLSHSTNAILNLVLFVIARKMLIYGDTMVDLILGTLAIAVVFIVKKYFIADPSFNDGGANRFSAARTVEGINQEYNLQLPTDVSNTIGGLVYYLFKEKNILVEEGGIVLTETHSYEILSCRHGVIEEVRIQSLS